MKKIYVSIVFFYCSITAISAAETIWLEAEHLRGIEGSCFPDLQENETQGAWGMAGPGVAPEWTQGGESEWLSIGCGPKESKATATAEIEVPVAGTWKLWVRYRDWRKETELFKVTVEQNGKSKEAVFGDKTVVDENDEMKLLWKWAFGWDSKELTLEKGQAKVILSAHVSQKVHRQVDVICLTTDLSYYPHHREKPFLPVWKILEDIKRKKDVFGYKLLVVKTNDFNIPAAWHIKTFSNKGFIYLWNVGEAWKADLASQNPQRILPVSYTHLTLPTIYSV